jgi:AcrR family transcriptional regulator
MQAAPRTRLTPEERRAQLVALGVAALADRPIDELTIPYLSEKAGVSRGLLFYYFGSGQGLHREVVTTARDAMLHATEPQMDLAPLDRLHDTLTRLVQFVRDHRGTFFSLVRGAASGGVEVREVVEQARVLQAERVIAVFLELGTPDSQLFRIAMRSWVAFAEQVLVESAVDASVPPEETVAFLERTATAVVESVARV